jgi:hypothetical protein
MHELLRRIALHGGLTAFILAIIGFFLAEMAASTMLTPVGTRGSAAQIEEEKRGAEAVAERMRTSIPLAMAVMGFVFVAAVEGARHLVRGGHKPPAAPPPPDETEKLLEELLTQAESKMATSGGPGEGGSSTQEPGKPVSPETPATK